MDGCSPEEKETGNREKDGERRYNRSGQGLVDRVVDDLIETEMFILLHVFPDTIKDDHGVIQGKTGQGQQGGND